HSRPAAIQPPDRPRADFGIEGTNGEGSIRARRDLNDVVVHVAKPAERLLGNANTGKGLPLRAARKANAEPAVGNLPTANEEVEICRSSGIKGKRHGEPRIVIPCAPGARA